MVTLFDHLDREQANTLSLVLNASGIGNQVLGAKDGFRIDVPQPSVDAARDVIQRYQAENQDIRDTETDSRRYPVPKNLSGVAVAFLLLSVHLAVFTSAAPEDYLAVFGANARRIMDGEVYRCATALLLHAHAAHIAGNMAGMALFGGAVGAVCGSGVGWLMILTCGILGNLMNALAYANGHLSVGASTAVFGAVGILCALQAVDAVRTGKGWQRMVVVFGAGVALLAFLGTSEQSDLGAHLFGFLSGVLTGGAYRLWIKHLPGRRGQVLCGTIALSVLLLSWARGVTG
jgi:membrane associated rhomboid family serine protease